MSKLSESCHRLHVLVVVAVVCAMALAVVKSMDQMKKSTTSKPETTTEEVSGRLLSLPVPKKCAESKKHGLQQNCCSLSVMIKVKSIHPHVRLS